MFEIRIFLRCRRCYADDICYISITVNIIHSQMENLFKRALAAFLYSLLFLLSFVEAHRKPPFLFWLVFILDFS